MKYLYLACCMLLSLTNYAQKAKLVISDELEIDNKKFAINDILGSDGKLIYLKGYRGNKLWFASMDKSFKIQKSIEVDKDKVIKDMELIDIRMVKNNIVLITELEQKKEGKITNYVWTLNTQTMTFDQPKIILEVSQKVIKRPKFSFMGIGLTNGNFSDQREVFYSADTSKFAILASIPPNDKEEGKYNKFLMNVFDINQNKLWSSELEVPQSHEFFVSRENTLGNDGSYHTIGLAYDDEKEMKKGKNGTNMIITYDSKGKAHETKLDFGDKAIVSPTFNWSDNFLICAGFYYIKGSKKNITEGIAYIKMDKQGKVIKESFKEFPDDFIQSMRDAKKSSTEKNKDGEIGISDNFKIRGLQARPDGGAFLFAEEYSSYTVTTYTTNSSGRGTTSTSTTYYVFGDKFVCGISPNGDFEWLTDIPTNMTFTNREIGTIATFSNQSNLYMIYLDNEINLKKKLNERPNSKVKYKRLSAGIVGIDIKTGKAERRELIDSKDEEFVIMPKVYANLNGEMYILGGKIGVFTVKEFKIAKITF